MPSPYDCILVGGGIVGLATGYRLLERFPGTRLLILEKEQELAFHQTGRNSGVLHSGIYYKPGSLKAVNCRAGKRAMEEFCEREQIPFDLCGKVIVATDETERGRMEDVFRRGRANGVNCRMISVEELAEIEPHCAGVAAIHVPETGIVDYKAVSRKLAQRLRELGAELMLHANFEKATDRNQRVRVRTSHGEFEAKFLITCAGLQSDRVIAGCGIKPRARIVPFRGEYFELTESAEHLCRGLIYPVPDPKFPFLGVHFTRMISGGVECGPNAVLSLGRESYGKLGFNMQDAAAALTYRGFLRIAGRHWKMGLGEMYRSMCKSAFVKALRRLVPEIRGKHLKAAAPGIRAQAVKADGTLVDDFLIQEADRMIHVANAPSPAATASLNIGQHIVDLYQSRVG